ncbi:MAG: DUF819 family protein [Bacteroidota bacterium]
MLATLLTSILLLSLPALILYGESRVRLISWLSPAFFCYAIGILIGNLFPISEASNQIVLNASVVLAIPLLLFSANVRHWLRLARTTVISYLLYLLSLTCSILIAYYFFQELLNEPIHAAAMAGSVYSGGTANMGAVKIALGASEQLFGEMNLSDLMLSGIYLLVILSGLHRLLLRIMPAFPQTDSSDQETSREDARNEFASLLVPEQLRQVLGSLALSIGMVGLMAGLSWLIWKDLAEIPLLIGITLGGLGLSFLPGIRQYAGTYETGEYLFLMFCVSVGMLVDIQLLFEGTAIMIGFMACVLYGGVLLHTILGMLFRLDADTVLITNVAGVFGPPFIGPVSKVLGNREIIITGLTLSVINLAIGNLLGLFFYWLLGGT